MFDSRRRGVDNEPVKGRYGSKGRGTYIGYTDLDISTLLLCRVVTWCFGRIVACAAVEALLESSLEYRFSAI